MGGKIIIGDDDEYEDGGFDDLPPLPDEDDFESDDPDMPEDDDDGDDDDGDDEAGKKKEGGKPESEELATLRAELAQERAIRAAIEAARTPQSAAVTPVSAAPVLPDFPTPDEFIDDPVGATKKMYERLRAEDAAKQQAQQSSQQAAMETVRNYRWQASQAAAIELVPELKTPGTPELKRFHALLAEKPEYQNDLNAPAKIAAQIAREKYSQETTRKNRARMGTMHGAGRGSEAGTRTHRMSEVDRKIMKQCGVLGNAKAEAAYMKAKYGK